MTQYPTAEMIKAGLADLRDRKLLKYLFADDPEQRGAYGYVDRPLDLETQHEVVSSTYLAMRAKEQSHSPTGDDVAERLMREFYVSKAYDPKAARPADTVKAAIQFTIATLSPNGVSQSAVEERIARLSLDVGRLLAADPICGGRVSGGTVQAIAALATQPDTGLRGAADKLEAMRAALERIQEEANTVGPDWRETASMIDSICIAALNLNRERG